MKIKDTTIRILFRPWYEKVPEDSVSNAMVQHRCWPWQTTQLPGGESITMSERHYITVGLSLFKLTFEWLKWPLAAKHHPAYNYDRF